MVTGNLTINLSNQQPEHLQTEEHVEVYFADGWIIIKPWIIINSVFPVDYSCHPTDLDIKQQFKKKTSLLSWKLPVILKN